jgi:hypothetical protein
MLLLPLLGKDENIIIFLMPVLPFAKSNPTFWYEDILTTLISHNI